MNIYVRMYKYYCSVLRQQLKEVLLPSCSTRGFDRLQKTDQNLTTKIPFILEAFYLQTVHNVIVVKLMSFLLVTLSLVSFSL